MRGLFMMGIILADSGGAQWCLAGPVNSLEEVGREMERVAEGDLDAEDAAGIDSDEAGKLSGTCSKNESW